MPARQRLSIPFEEWPEVDQTAWQKVFTAGDIFDDSGQGLRLSNYSRRNLFFGYGRWLGFLLRNHPATLEDNPLVRLTPDHLMQFIEDMSDGRKPITVYNAASHLYSAVRLMYPRADLDWMKAVVRKLKSRAGRRSSRPLFDSATLFDAGVGLMEENRPRIVESPRARQAFRDGLIIAFLAVRPLRRRSLAALRIGQHLQRVGETWTVVMRPEDVKNQEPLEFLFPEPLVDSLEFYLSEARPRFPGADRHDGLWATSFGTPMSGDALYDCVVRRTKALLGRPVTLHDFRRAAGTTLAIHAPEKVGAAQHLLGHRNPATTRDHYILAGNLEAGRCHQAGLVALRRRVARNRRQTP